MWPARKLIHFVSKILILAVSANEKNQSLHSIHIYTLELKFAAEIVKLCSIKTTA